MRAEGIALMVRSGLGFVGILLLLFLYFGTGAERAPIGLLIGVTLGGLAGLWWVELQVQKALAKAKEAR
jgi:hypothetical protein